MVLWYANSQKFGAFEMVHTCYPNPSPYSSFLLLKLITFWCLAGNRIQVHSWYRKGSKRLWNLVKAYLLRWEYADGGSSLYVELYQYERSVCWSMEEFCGVQVHVTQNHALCSIWGEMVRSIESSVLSWPLPLANKWVLWLNSTT